MTKRELFRILKYLPMNTVIGFRANDLDKTFPAEPFTFGDLADDDDFAKIQQGIDFIFR